MNCKCGGSTKSSSHKVTTIKAAKEWHPETLEIDLPLRLDLDTCACGRQYAIGSTESNGELRVVFTK